jgi:ferredoxin-NADP reductase
LTAAGPRLGWRTATIRDIHDETAHARTLVLDVPGWPGHTAGQHTDIRLTAEDGYQAQRSYSIASAPESADLELTIERIDDGEVSPYLVDEARPGDQFELRGPIGGYFVWWSDLGGPLLLVGGGSGLVPLMAMLRHREAAGSDADARLLLSARTVDDVLYRDELAGLTGAAVHITLTRGEMPPGFGGFSGRIDREMLAAVGPEPSARARVYVCGPTPFVEEAARLLVGLGHDPSAVRTERFGPTGG